MSEPLDPEVAILNAALELPESQRAAFLDEACSGHPVLREQIEALLKAESQAGDFLETPALGPARPLGDWAVPPLTEKPGDRIGRYHLLQQIGQGGCGVVYMAEQEEPVRRRVALKVIKLGMDTEQVIARFEAERQALAMMDHPNIARVLDAGATGPAGPASQISNLKSQIPQGRPYFVMELVSGVKITDYCDQQGASTRERIALFVQVCQAIQHAHQKGIIHRDIKPSNILVAVHDGAPVPKVIDFGIAKATQGRLTDRTLFTAFAQFVGTPAYMSPEQAAVTSLDIDTRSDIYSLGVLLYELLTGRTPFDQEELLDAGLDEMRRTIREKEPPKPSTRLTQELAAVPGRGAGAPVRGQGHLQERIHRVRGDLDWIVMKCLEKDRTRRYETAIGLVADIQRHLNHEPVHARPPSQAYRLQKWVRRNKLVFAALSVLATALVVVAVGSTIAAWRVAGARRAELRERQNAEEANRQLRQTLSVLELDRAEDLFQAHNAAAGVAHLAAILRRDPTNATAASRLVSALAHRRWAVAATPPMRHFGRIGVATFDPAGRRVLSASWDRTACLWDAATGQRLVAIRHESAVAAACFSPDGLRFATGCADGAVRVWDAATGSALTPVMGHGQKVVSIEFSPDGRLVLVATAGETAWIWNAADGSLGRELRGHGSDITAARFSPNGRLVATAASRGTLRLWSAESGQTVFRMPGRGGGIQSLAFSPDGSRLACAHQDGTMTVWDPAGGSLVEEIKAHSKVIWSVAFSPDGNLLLTASEDATARLWDVGKLRPLGEPLRHESGVTFGAFSPDSKSAVTASSDNTAVVWDAATGIPLCQPLRHIERILHASFGPGGRRLVTGSYDGLAQVWELRPCFDPGLEVHHGLDVLPMAFAPGGGALLTTSKDKSARLWSALTGQPLCDPLRHDSLLRYADFAPDGRRVVICCVDGTVRVWDCGDWKMAGAGGAPPRVVAGPFGHSNLVWMARFNLDGSRVVTASADGTARVWDPLTGQPATDWMVHGGPVLTAQFDRDGRRVVTASEDRTARVWDAQTGRPVTGPLTHLDHVKAAEFSPDGAKVVTASTDNTARIWDARTGEALTPALQHARIVGCAVFSQDGRRVATGSLDRTARVWDAGTGQALTPVLRHHNSVECVIFSADGQRLVTASREGAARVWDANTGQPLTEWLNAGTYWQVRFDPESERIAMGARGGAALVWETPRAPVPVPEWFPDLAEAVAGIRLGTRGNVELVSRQELARMARRLPWTGSASAYSRLLEWFLVKPAGAP